MQLSDHELWEYIREDIPYFDLTTHILETENKKASLAIKTREELFVACIEEAARIGELLGCQVLQKVSSGRIVKAGDTLLEFQADSQVLHQAWRVAQILLEYSCGMATQAHKMAQAVKNVNSKCEVFTTRKSFPFAKRFVMCALVTANVLPHRLGLSESVLIFHNHRALYTTEKDFETAMTKIKERCVEKKLVVESETLEDAKKMLSLGADVIQMDKSVPETLQQLVMYKQKHYPEAKILAAGGINIQNAKEYASSGVDGIVTSSLYTFKLADLTSSFKTI
ncbi:ModD protein [Sulfurimonas sp. C5]|uniref:ModD protein n=1 Tax=Sulfurimonas sp. C5 TaxID=3036947 RepID=UPI0024539400|nr:ModD protein [Sulfurimonas sp. C5]MDH4943897.1 ModD protein [Sulfurimonas sp. C5]